MLKKFYSQVNSKSTSGKTPNPWGCILLFINLYLLFSFAWSMKSLKMRLQKIESKNKYKALKVFVVDDGVIVGGDYDGQKLKDINQDNALIINLEWC